MSEVLARLEAAEAELAAAKREVAQAHCSKVGHTWESYGGANCGCCEDGCCSVPVFVCTKCGDCDYGDNDEAAKVRSDCEARAALYSPLSSLALEGSEE